MTSNALLFITSFCLINNMTPLSSIDQNTRFTSSPGSTPVVMQDANSDLKNQPFANKAQQSDQILDLSGQGLTNAQLQKRLDAFKNPLSLHVLDISNNNLTGTIDLERFKGLYYLDCSNNKIEQLNLNAIIIRIDCSYNRLSSLHLSDQIYVPDEQITEILTEREDITFDPTKIDIQNNFSNQNVYKSVGKSETTFALNTLFPGIIQSRMHDLKGATRLTGDNATEIKGNEFSYQYDVVEGEPMADTPKYSLEVTVHLDRYDDGTIKNPTINIPEEIGKGTVGKQDTNTKSQSIYRLYNPNSGEHFYTTNVNEKNHLVQVGWKDEGIGWIAPEISMQPVYRLYNPNAGDHHYTTNIKERDHLLTVGWKYEQISFYSDEYKTVPLYRQYNPNAISGAHNYTTDQYENDKLVSLGWKAEDIAWYALEK